MTEVLSVVAILAVLYAILSPVMQSAREEGQVQASLSRLGQLKTAALIYVSEISYTVPDDLPPHEVVYNSYLGLGVDAFRSPCGYRAIVPNEKQLGYQYVWDGDPETRAYFDEVGDHGLLFTDASCNRNARIWRSEAATKLGLGVRVDGSLVKLRKSGWPGVLSWWEEK